MGEFWGDPKMEINLYQKVDERCRGASCLSFLHKRLRVSKNTNLVIAISGRRSNAAMDHWWNKIST
jgi:hypothetical protein